MVNPRGPRPHLLRLGAAVAALATAAWACDASALALQVAAEARPAVPAGDPPLDPSVDQVGGPSRPEPPRPVDEAGDGRALNLLIATLALDRDPLSDTLYLYESGDDVLLPVGELARQLTLGVTVDPVARTASGFLLREGAGFRIDPAVGKVFLADREEDFDPARVRWIDGDLYVPARLLSRWWPVDFRFSMNALSLQALPREKLPIQLKLERERAATRLGGRTGGYVDPGFPRLANPHGFASVPMVDATLGLGANRAGDRTTGVAALSATFAGDLLGMEATGYASVSKADPKADIRITLSRNQPEGGLLGPLDATSVRLGDVGLPALKNVLAGAGAGWGASVTNRPLNSPSSYGLQTLRGELPQGWDVTLYFNDALIAFARSRGDGLYEFPDQPLVFGRNEFRLVFNGPLGQRRVETQVYTLDQTVTRPGEVYYFAGAQRDGEDTSRATLQVDLGLARGLSVTAGAVHIKREDNRQSGRALDSSYVNAGLRASALGSLFNLDHTQDVQGGAVTEAGVRTRIRGISLDASRTWIHDFASDEYALIEDPLRVRDQVRLTGSLDLSPRMRLPFAVDVRREETASGIRTLDVQPRLSVNAGGASFTNSLDWRFAPGGDSIAGALQASRRVAGVGVSGQVAYALRPSVRMGSLAMTLDRNLGENNRVSLGVVQAFDPGKTTVTAGWTRNFGAFSVGFSGLYAGSREMGFGVQVTSAFGRNPRSGQALRDWRPMAGSGAVAAKVFVDSNLNGRFDPEEEPIPNAGFTVNGGGRQAPRSDARGETVLTRLQPGTYADLALDLGTLEDAQWQPTRPGVRVLPRPGKVQVVDFPVVLTAEIDGTVYLAGEGGRRGIGNARLQLVDSSGRIVGETVSGGDGYFIVPNVRPGTYRLRIAPEQLTGLRLTADAAPEVKVNARADFVNGVDITLSRIR